MPRRLRLDMSGYLYTLALAAVVISVVCAVVPGGMNGNLRALCALCMICLICAPLTGVIGALTDADWEIPESWLGQDTEAVPEQDYEQFSKQMLAGQLALLLQEKFSLSPAEVRVYAEWDTDGTPERVTLVLSGKAIWQDPDPIRDYVEKLLGCECVIVLD